MLVIVSFAGCDNANNGNINELQDDSFKYDMFLPHEGFPSGVPESWDWQSNPNVQAGIHLPDGWKAIIGWGQVYAEKNHPNPNIDFPLVRVHIKDLKVYIYQADRTWKQVLSTQRVDGWFFKEDFGPDNGIIPPLSVQNELDGGISVQAGSGFNFHYWNTERASVSRDNLLGVFVTCKARLTGVENYSETPKYLLMAAADYWKDLTGVQYNEDGTENNCGVAAGRFKYITPEWNIFTMHTFSQEEVESIVFPY